MKLPEDLLIEARLLFGHVPIRGADSATDRQMAFMHRLCDLGYVSGTAFIRDTPEILIELGVWAENEPDDLVSSPVAGG